MGENLPTSRPETAGDLEPEFTLDELLGELAEFAGPPPRLPGDIDRWMLQVKYACNEKRAKCMIARAVESGEWERVQVYDLQREHVVTVIRKISK